MPHAHDFGPGYGLLPIANFLRKRACRFTNNLKVSYEPVLNEFIRLKHLTSARGIAFDVGDPI